VKKIPRLISLSIKLSTWKRFFNRVDHVIDHGRNAVVGKSGLPRAA